MGKHYWFFLNTVAIKYPDWPNSVTKSKYYDFIQNFPLFIPDESMGDNFSKLLYKFPVTTYLDTKLNFIKWIYLIHNEINKQLNKEQIPFEKFYEKYYEQYKSTDIKTKSFFGKLKSFIDKYILLIKPYQIVSSLIAIILAIVFKLYSFSLEKNII